jgi:CDP-diacylglycerol--glycerol-3-phosphate 3-phosphatidyltransferase
VVAAIRYGVVSVFGNAANLLTIARIVGSPFLFWLILEGTDDLGASWGAFALGWTLGATDFLDGPLARRRGTVSKSGAFLDPIADKLVVLGSMWALVEVGRYAWLPVVIIAIREFGITGFRMYWARQGLSVPARPSGKYKTFVQGVAISFALMPTLSSADLFLDICLWVAVAFTVWSGIEYVLDGRGATSESGSLSEV